MAYTKQNKLFAASKDYHMAISTNIHMTRMAGQPQWEMAQPKGDEYPLTGILQPLSSNYKVLKRLDEFNK
jgi:hypothetical protein